MKLFFATKNEAKLKRYANKLKEKGVEVLSIKDLEKEIDVKEDGKDALENAFQKAKAYYEETGITTMGVDDTLYIENVSEDKQPGTHVRRINGKYLNDEEMIKYYTNLAKEYGGKLVCKWIYGLVIYDGKNRMEYTWSKDKFYLVDTVSDAKNPGYPLDSVTVVPKFNKYLSELTEEERKQKSLYDSDGEAIEFIINSLKK